MADRPISRNVFAGDGTWVENRPSKWQQTWNILAPYITEPANAMVRLFNDPAILYGFPPTEQTIADSLMLSGLATGGSAFAPKPQNAMTMGIRAFHGSPHSFTRFDMSKIGTGEGAQAYGHGLYFAENEGVAEAYKKNLARVKNYVTDGIIRKYGGIDSAINALKAEIRDLSSTTFSQNLPGSQKLLDQQIARRQSILDSLIAQKTENQVNPGSMYEVDINANPEAFLDWDKPMGEQLDVASKIPGWDFRVQEWLRSKIGPDPRTLTGAQFLARTTTDPAKTSSALSKAGIPGVKYLDAGSRVPSAIAKKELAEWQAQLLIAEKELADAIARGDKFLIGRKQAEVQRVKDGIARVAKEAEGTRNYVVFDDELISIVRKYGIAGASAILGYNLLENVSKAQAEELRRIEKTGVKK